MVVARGLVLSPNTPAYADVVGVVDNNSVYVVVRCIRLNGTAARVAVTVERSLMADVWFRIGANPLMQLQKAASSGAASIGPYEGNTAANKVVLATRFIRVRFDFSVSGQGYAVVDADLSLKYL